MILDKFIRLNIAFKPPKNIIEKAISISREIGENNNTFFILDGIQFYPHITIYAPKYHENNIEKLLNGVKEIVKNSEKIEFQFQKISVSQGYMGIKFNYSPNIKILHEKIVETLNPFQKEYMKKEYQNGFDYHFNFSSEQEKNIREYGYPDAMNLYSPHLTITRLKNASLTKKISENIKWDISLFTINQIAVYEMGEHGVCKKLLGKFNLL